MSTKITVEPRIYININDDPIIETTFYAVAIDSDLQFKSKRAAQNFKKDIEKIFNKRLKKRNNN